MSRKDHITFAIVIAAIIAILTPIYIYISNYQPPRTTINYNDGSREHCYKAVSALQSQLKHRTHQYKPIDYTCRFSPAKQAYYVTINYTDHTGQHTHIAQVLIDSLGNTTIKGRPI